MRHGFKPTEPKYKRRKHKYRKDYGIHKTKEEVIAKICFWAFICPQEMQIVTEFKDI